MQVYLIICVVSYSFVAICNRQDGIPIFDHHPWRRQQKARDNAEYRRILHARKQATMTNMETTAGKAISHNEAETAGPWPLSAPDEFSSRDNAQCSNSRLTHPKRDTPIAEKTICHEKKEIIDSRSDPEKFSLHDCDRCSTSSRLTHSTRDLTTAEESVGRDEAEISPVLGRPWSASPSPTIGQSMCHYVEESVDLWSAPVEISFTEGGDEIPSPRTPRHSDPPTTATDEDNSVISKPPTTTTDDDISIMTAIVNGDWKKVIKVAKKNPSEVSKWQAIELGTSHVRLLPIHYACTIGAPQNVINVLVKAAPETLTYVDHHGHTLLHWVVNKRTTTPQTVKAILKQCPESALLKCSKDGALPIHMACRRSDMPVKNQVRIVKLLIGAYPDGLFFKDGNHLLPLHIAAKTGAPATFIKMLIKACPAAAAVDDMNHRLPIHHAVENSHLWSDDDAATVVTSLVDAFSGGLEWRDTQSGFTPLAIACTSSRAPESLIALLLDMCPDAASIPDFDNRIPNLPLDALIEEEGSDSESTSSGDWLSALPPVSLYPTIPPIAIRSETEATVVDGRVVDRKDSLKIFRARENKICAQPPPPLVRF